MQAISKLIDIEIKDSLSTKYIENELTKLNITPLRWAIVHVSDKMYKVSVANLKE